MSQWQWQLSFIYRSKQSAEISGFKLLIGTNVAKTSKRFLQTKVGPVARVGYNSRLMMRPSAPLEDPQPWGPQKPTVRSHLEASCRVGWCNSSVYISPIQHSLFLPFWGFRTASTVCRQNFRLISVPSTGTKGCSVLKSIKTRETRPL